MWVSFIDFRNMIFTLFIFSIKNKGFHIVFTYCHWTRQRVLSNQTTYKRPYIQLQLGHIFQLHSATINWSISYSSLEKKKQLKIDNVIYIQNLSKQPSHVFPYERYLQLHHNFLHFFFEFSVTTKTTNGALCITTAKLLVYAWFLLYKEA